MKTLYLHDCSVGHKLSVFALLPQVLVVNKDVSFCMCYPFPEEWGTEYAQGIVMARFLIFYAIPLSIITLFYIMIAKHLMYSASHVPGEIQGAVRQVSSNHPHN